MLDLLIVFAEKAVAALIGSGRHSGLALAALYDFDVEMGTGQTFSPLDMWNNGFSMG